MGEVVPIHSRRTFSKDEAEALLPVVKRITAQASRDVEAFRDQLRYVPHTEQLYHRVYSQIELAVRRWAIKVSKLGCEPRGMWLVDFDSGSGWFTWRLGDEELAFFHSHEAARADLGTQLPREFPT